MPSSAADRATLHEPGYPKHLSHSPSLKGEGRGTLNISVQERGRRGGGEGRRKRGGG